MRERAGAGRVFCRLRGGIVCAQVWQRRWRRGFGAWSPGAVETLPLIARRAEVRVEGRAVGRRLGREDEGVWLRATACVAGADGGSA